MTTWFTSDTHFGHRLMAFLRGFSEAQERTGVTDLEVQAHDEHIIRTWNSTVAPDDVVWHLGDFSLKNPSSDWYKWIAARLNGDIRLILGNHDLAHPLNRTRSIGAFPNTVDCFPWVSTVAQTVIHQEQWHQHVMLCHFPYTADSDIREDEDVKAREDALQQWRLPDCGQWLLCGHTHSPTAYVSGSREVQVGWDAWHRPVSEDEIAEIIRNN